MAVTDFFLLSIHCQLPPCPLDTTGFSTQLNEIHSMIRKNRQTLFFSATWPEHVQKVAAGLLKTNPIHLRIGSNNDEGNEGQNRLIVQETIDQEVLVMQNATEKSIELKQRLSLLKKDQGKTIVFFKTKHLCDETARLYGNLPNLPPSAALHGNLPQSERLEVMAAFRSSDIRLLFATDVAARGLDIVDIDLGMYISEKQFARRKFEKDNPDNYFSFFCIVFSILFQSSNTIFQPNEDKGVWKSTSTALAEQEERVVKERRSLSFWNKTMRNRRHPWYKCCCNAMQTTPTPLKKTPSPKN